MAEIINKTNSVESESQHIVVPDVQQVSHHLHLPILFISNTNTWYYPISARAKSTLVPSFVYIRRV